MFGELGVSGVVEFVDENDGDAEYEESYEQNAEIFFIEGVCQLTVLPVHFIPGFKI